MIDLITTVHIIGNVKLGEAETLYVRRLWPKQMPLEGGQWQVRYCAC